MALVSCLECGRKISSQTEACPSCGCPVSEKKDADLQEKDGLSLSLQQENSPAEEALESPLEPPKKKRKKRQLVAAVLAALLIVGGLTGFFIYQYDLKSNYKYIMQKAKIAMAVGALLSDIQCNTTSQVWYDSIYEKYNPDTFVYIVPGNFNASIARLYDDPSIKERIEAIQKNQKDVHDFMDKLRNPPVEFNEIYKNLNQLYSLYLPITELAVNPTGNLTDYFNKKKNYVKEFKSFYIKLDMMLPDPPPKDSSSNASVVSFP